MWSIQRSIIIFFQPKWCFFIPLYNFFFLEKINFESSFHFTYIKQTSLIKSKTFYFCNLKLFLNLFQKWSGHSVVMFSWFISLVILLYIYHLFCCCCCCCYDYLMPLFTWLYIFLVLVAHRFKRFNFFVEMKYESVEIILYGLYFCFVLENYFWFRQIKVNFR